NKPSDALDELYRLPTCLVCTFSAETRLQLLSAIASETVSDDSRDNAAIDLMRCFVDKSQGDVLFKAFEENHQFINALFNRVQDDYTQDVFIALFLEAYTQRYSTDEPQVQPNSYYVANRTITGVYLGSNRLNGPPYTITLRQLDTRVGHYTNVQRYNPCDVVGMVIPAIESSSQDQIIYLPALYLYSVLQQKAQQDLVDFLVGAAQVAGIFSGTSLFISGVSTFQKVMGCVEALNAATNVVLETDAVRTQLLATEYGQDFLDSWGTISTAVDLATVGAALATFRRTAPQVLDEIDNFVPEGSLGIQNIRRVSGAVSVFKAGDNIAGKTIVQVRLGTNGKVAVIGRQMDDHVKNIAAHLKNNQGLQVEILDDGYLNRTFDIDGVEWTVNSAWDDMKKNPLYKDMKDPITGHIKAEYIEQIPMYKLNKQWVEYIQLEGFTIIDIGYPQGVTSESLFYNMEISTINW
ncbi:MAG: hypothetical protein PHS05_03845, partial [Bacteroidales bacterium]|nr:hypothetical protein [Bacteroidales bacterium]